MGHTHTPNSVLSTDGTRMSDSLLPLGDSYILFVHTAPGFFLVGNTVRTPSLWFWFCASQLCDPEQNILLNSTEEEPYQICVSAAWQPYELVRTSLI